MAKKDEVLEANASMHTPDPEEYVTFTVPYSDDEWDNAVLISVNGENVRIRRGETVKVKRKFVEVYENSQAQKKAAREAMRGLKIAEPIKM